jgi:hypothetical protein
MLISDACRRTRTLSESRPARASNTAITAAATSGTTPEMTIAVWAPATSAIQPISGLPTACPPTAIIVYSAITRPRMMRFDDIWTTASAVVAKSIRMNPMLAKTTRNTLSTGASPVRMSATPNSPAEKMMYRSR